MSTWQRIKRSLRGCRPGLSFGLLSFEEGYAFDFFGLFLSLPFLDKWHKEPEEMMDRWGFYYFPDGSDLVLEWGKLHKRIRMPWSLDHIITLVKKPDGTWVKEKTDYGRKSDVYDQPDWSADGRWRGFYVYRYTLKSGEIQVRTATVDVSRMEWRPLWFKWTRLFSKVRISINVRFDDEVGERTGSWKGGCLGCGYTMKPGENPEETLRRMERERKF